MFEDFIKSAQVHISERLSSPLMGSFVVSWCLWNYRFFVVLFSSATVTQTFKMIDTLIFPDLTTSILRGCLFPALTAATYIFLYPFPAKFVYGFTRRRQKEVNDLRQKIEDETPLTIEESRAIRAEVTRTESEYLLEIDHKNKEIERLRVELKALGTSRTVVVPQLDIGESIELEPSQLEMLSLIEGFGGDALEEKLVALSKESKTKAQYDLGELVQKNFLTCSFDMDEQGNMYHFTHAGRRYVLDHKKRFRLLQSQLIS